MKMKSRLNEERAELARRQELFLSALLEVGDAPPGTNEDQVSAAANALFLKRLRTIARLQPSVVEELGDRFFDTVKAFAARHPGIHHAGPCADAAQLRREVSLLRLSRVFRLYLFTLVAINPAKRSEPLNHHPK